MITPQEEIPEVAYLSDISVAGSDCLNLKGNSDYAPPPKDGSFKAKYELKTTDVEGSCIPDKTGYPRW